MQSLTRSRVAVIAMMALLVGLVAAVAATATPAEAATAVTEESCLWSYDNDTRDQPLTFTGEATPDPAAVGQNLTLGGATVQTTLDPAVGQLGADFGIFQVGNNTLTGKSWFAIEGSNTSQTKQIVSANWTATVVVSGAPGSYVAQPTPITFTLPDTTWTPQNTGTVEFKQAAAGAFTAPIPGGVNGVNVTPKGAAWVSVSVGPLTLTLDCAAGNQADPFPTNGVRPIFESVAVGAGSTTTTTTTPGSTTTTTTPGSTTTTTTPTTPTTPATDHDCISGLGRYKSQEIQTIKLGLSRTPIAITPTPAASQVSLNNVKLQLVVPGDIILQGYRDSHGIYGAGANEQLTQAWVAIQGTNTVEGVQTVAAEAKYTTVVTDPTPADKNSGDETAADVNVTLNLPTSTWTATGTGAIEFREAPGGSLSPIGVIGTGYQETPYKVYPYGSIFVRAETKGYGANLDCVAGKNVKVNPAPVPAYSNFGNLPPAAAGAPPVVPSNPDRGSRGRYTVTPGDPQAAFATASTDTTPENAGEKGQIATVKVVGAPLQLKVAGRLVNLSTVSLNGADQSSTGALKQVTVIDPRGSNAGWNLVGLASVFNGSNGTIASSNLGWTPKSTATAGPAVTGGLDAAQTLCSATSGASAGSFTCDASLGLKVPAATPLGTYTSTLSLTLI